MSPLPLESTTSTVAEGASVAIVSLTPARAEAGRRSKTRASRQDRIATPARWARAASVICGLC